MMNISVVTKQNGWRRGPCDFYPLIKWNKNLKREGININFISDHKQKIESDIVILDHRYYEMIIKNNRGKKKRGPKNKDFIKNFLNNLAANGKKTILFENGDGAGSRHFDMIEHVDLFVKKQVLKNTKEYTVDNGFSNKMVFVGHYGLTEKQIEKNKATNIDPCPKDQIHKIKCGWNIGMQNYMELPAKKIFPNRAKAVLDKTLGGPNFTSVELKRDIDASYRGALKDFSENYSWQRKKVIEFLQSDSVFNFITGKGLPKKKYLEELRKSKICISPFGWGEVCYRDFEAIINGAILVKPHMNHINTYPNIYLEGETYISLDWDLKNIENVMRDLLNNYDDYKRIAINASELYKDNLLSYNNFSTTFKKLIKYVC